MNSYGKLATYFWKPENVSRNYDVMLTNVRVSRAQTNKNQNK